MTTSTLPAPTATRSRFPRPFSGSALVSPRSSSSSPQKCFWSRTTPCTTPTGCRYLRPPSAHPARARRNFRSHHRPHQFFPRGYASTIFNSIAFSAVSTSSPSLSAPQPVSPSPSAGRAYPEPPCRRLPGLSARLPRSSRAQPPDRPASPMDGALLCRYLYLRFQPLLNLWPRYWSHLGDTFAAVGIIAFTLASLLIVDLGLNWRELTTRGDGGQL